MNFKFSSTRSMNIESAVYEAALGLDADERRAFLEQVFRDDEEGLANMEAMLRDAGESAAYFLGASEVRSSLASRILEEIPVEEEPDAPANEEMGSRIGPYRLLSRIGEGGYGVVYEAEQEEPVRRAVALKIIRLGMDTERVIARFEAERQALAMMDHPNIAHVFDAGATAAGRPYFVMERVAGERITRYCDREKLDLVARIRLFICVCNAIQHAHQKGVIHRDIKPSNVLVADLDGVPVPKVIDFGIAKATGDREVDPASPRTGRDQLLGTPPYMSPEQVDMGGIDVDTRADVYSLGALLYELLGGRAPFDARALADGGVSAMRRVILESEPPLISKMLADLPPGDLAEIAAARGEEPARLVARVRGDLDGIVSTAMAKDRNARYQTVNALAADLRRFLADEPVVARRPGRLYLAGKFIRRNRIACLLSAAVVVSLIAGLGASTWLYFRERVALAEQQRLRRKAEAAQAVEARLRAQAQARANVSQAAVLVSEGRIDEADALVGKVPPETIEPSREAAEVFRALGNWNAFYGRWKPAVQYYTLLNQANRLDPPDEIVEECEVLAISAAFLADGDAPSYDAFRREILDLYLPARNSFQAEHILQACLLTPADPGILGRLRDVAKVCLTNSAPASSGEYYPDWEAFALALYYHRLGKPEETLKWAEKCLSYPVTTNSRSREARIAATYCLMAMAKFRRGEGEATWLALQRARGMIADNLQSGLEGNPSLPGVWYTWVFARVLLREAEQEMKTPS